METGVSRPAAVLLAIGLTTLISCGKPAGHQSAAAPPERPPEPSAESLEPAFDQLIQPLIEDQWAHGIVVGTVADNRSELLYYGQRSADDPRPPDADTVFEIGSLTKVFTALLLADMVHRDELSLDDHVEQFLPEEVTVPRRGDRPIQLVELATHSSGLPGIAPNFWAEDDPIYDPDAGGRRWSGYSTQRLYECLNDLTLDDSPPSFVYSNLGMGLLGHVLERRSGKDYQGLLVGRICDPLGMNSTRISLDDALRGRLAAGHDADGEPTRPWDGEQSSLAGAFAIRSTPRDLMTFIKANLGLIDSPLAEAIKQTQTEHFRRSDLEQVGLGWNLNKYGVVFHSGTTGGYRCSMFLLPASSTGVFILTNTLVGGSTDARAAEFEKLGGSLLNVLVGAPPLPVALPSLSKTGAGDLAEFVGLYKLRPSHAEGLRVTLDDGKLRALIPGRVANRLYPSADDRFFMKAYDVSLSFTRDDAGQVAGAVVETGGQTQQLTRADR